MQEVYFYNPYHLGDSLLMVHFLRKVCKKYNDFKFICQISKGHFEEISNFIGEFQDRILLTKLVKHNKGINGWYGSIRLKTGVRDGIYVINERYDEFYEHLSKLIEIENPIKGKNCTLIDHPDIKKDVGLSCDILLVNSVPLSRQYSYVESHFENKISELKEKYKIISTRKTKFPDIPCTLDYKLNLMNIGNVSTKSKYIIGIATAPIMPCFNTSNVDTVKKWFVLSKRSSYSYNDRIFRKRSVTQVNVKELENGPA